VALLTIQAVEVRYFFCFQGLFESGCSSLVAASGVFFQDYKLKNIRKERKMTAEKLAWRAELSKACVTEAQKGTYDVKISTICAICKALDISLAEFFSTFS
jgi:DNA-binding XRE family transcriptional regulator